MQQVLRKCLFSLFLVIPALLPGCGGGGSSPPTSNVISTVTLNNGGALKVLSSGNGTYVIQGDTLSGVSAMDLTLQYDSATKSSPTVTQGGLVSGALMAANTNVPGSIRIAIVSVQQISGSGTVVTVSFATDSSPNTLTFIANSLINSQGTSLL